MPQSCLPQLSRLDPKVLNLTCHSPTSTPSTSCSPSQWPLNAASSALSTPPSPPPPPAPSTSTQHGKANRVSAAGPATQPAAGPLQPLARLGPRSPVGASTRRASFVPRGTEQPVRAARRGSRFSSGCFQVKPPPAAVPRERLPTSSPPRYCPWGGQC